jgi:hypothetical protein
MVVDSRTLSLIGLILSGVTAAIAIVAFFVVHEHVEGRLVVDSPPVAGLQVAVQSKRNRP